VAILSDVELNSMRDLVETALPDTAYIVRTGVDENYDDQGNLIEDETILGPYPCRVSPTRYLPFEQANANQFMGLSRWYVIFAYDVEVKLMDVIRVLGIDYSVVGIDNPMSFSITNRVTVEKRTG